MTDPSLIALRRLPAAELAARRERVRVLILTGLGLNCEAETEAAFRTAGATVRRVHLLDRMEAAGQIAVRYLDPSGPPAEQ